MNYYFIKYELNNCITNLISEREFGFILLCDLFIYLFILFKLHLLQNDTEIVTLLN